MRQLIKAGLCGFLLLVAGVNMPRAQVPVANQDAKPKKADAELGTLEQLQADAVKNHPDVKVAEARVRLEEAKLDRVRANLKGQIAIAYADVESARAASKEGFNRWLRALDLRNRKAIAEEDFGAAALTKAKLEADLRGAETRLQNLVGRPIMKNQREQPKNP